MKKTMIRKAVFILLFIFLPFYLYADSIHLHGGKIIKCKVIKTEGDYVEFDPEGDVPFDIIAKNEIKLIKYDNGQIERFSCMQGCCVSPYPMLKTYPSFYIGFGSGMGPLGQIWENGKEIKDKISESGIRDSDGNKLHVYDTETYLLHFGTGVAVIPNFHIGYDFLFFGIFIDYEYEDDDNGKLYINRNVLSFKYFLRNSGFYLKIGSGISFLKCDVIDADDSAPSFLIGTGYHLGGPGSFHLGFNLDYSYQRFDDAFFRDINILSLYITLYWF